jgi:hypothetical protein
MSQNQLAIQELCQQVKQLKDSLEDKDLYCDSLENDFLIVVRTTVDKVQVYASFTRWLTESDIYKEKIESCYTLSAKTKTGIQEGATESTDVLYFVC